MLTARDAMQQAIERAQLGDFEGARVWVDIARELRLGTPPIVLGADGKGYGPAEDVVYDATPMEADPATERFYLNGTTVQRAETEVIQRIHTEATPAYEAAGAGLGDTRAIPTRIAHPPEDARGNVAECLSCDIPIAWIRGRGWVHDVEGHPAGCDKALTVARRQDEV